jgi:hypothetical protein
MAATRPATGAWWIPNQAAGPQSDRGSLSSTIDSRATGRPRIVTTTSLRKRRPEVAAELVVPFADADLALQLPSLQRHDVSCTRYFDRDGEHSTCVVCQPLLVRLWTT